MPSNEHDSNMPLKIVLVRSLSVMKIALQLGPVYNVNVENLLTSLYTFLTAQDGKMSPQNQDKFS